MFLKTLVVLAVITVRPLVHEDVLEPSVANEVEHALDRAPPNAPSVAILSPNALSMLNTNGLSRTQLAIRLVSTQGADGRWTVGTNDVTTLAVKLLKEMID